MPDRNDSAKEHDPATSSRLRRLIDSGETGDKVDAADPAAAPLGTDDEAAGAGPSPGQAERAIEQEVGQSGNHPGVPKKGDIRPALFFVAAITAIGAVLGGVIFMLSI